ncbi:MAG: hypothetical protein WC505_07990 [Patescibacteria group bacterium]
METLASTSPASTLAIRRPKTPEIIRAIRKILASSNEEPLGHLLLEELHEVAMRLGRPLRPTATIQQVSQEIRNFLGMCGPVTYAELRRDELHAVLRALRGLSPAWPPTVFKAEDVVW